MDNSKRWIVRTLDVRTDGDIPDDDGWLSPAERDECAGWRNPIRRRDWRAGRWLLKAMIQSELSAQSDQTEPLPLSDIEILSRDALRRSVRPRACVAGRWLPWQLSLGHGDGVVCGVIAPAMDVHVGIDVVASDAPLNSADELWFTAVERQLMRSRPEITAQTLWAVKEAIYKSANCGEPFVPGEIEVQPLEDARFRWSCRGRSSSQGDMVHASRQGDWIVALALLSAKLTQREHVP